MQQHTPSPWHHETRGFRELTGPTFDIYPPANMLTGSRMPVAQTVTSEANARLIAAAPDMLHMLEFVLASGNCELDHETALLIQNTINKAKGA